MSIAPENSTEIRTARVFSFDVDDWSSSAVISARPFVESCEFWHLPETGSWRNWDKSLRSKNFGKKGLLKSRHFLVEYFWGVTIQVFTMRDCDYQGIRIIWHLKKDVGLRCLSKKLEKMTLSLTDTSIRLGILSFNQKLI